MIDRPWIASQHQNGSWSVSCDTELGWVTIASDLPKEVAMRIAQASPVETTTIFQVRYMVVPMVDHVYCRILAPDGTGYQVVGQVTLRKGRFDHFKNAFKAEYIDETPRVPEDQSQRAAYPDIALDQI